LLSFEGRVVLLNVAYAALVFRDNQRMRKSGGARRVNPDLREDRFFNLYSPGYVEEDATAPECCMQRCVFRAVYRYAGRHEVLLYQLGIVASGGLQACAHNARALQFLVRFAAHNRGVALHRQPSTATDERVL